MRHLPLTQTRYRDHHVAGTRGEALVYAQSAELADSKRRFLDASMADGRGGRHSTGVRWWIVYMVYGCGLSPLPDPRYMQVHSFAVFIEDKLEDMVVWLAVFRPSGQQCNRDTLSKYVS